MAGNNLFQILRGSNPNANHILNPGQPFYNKAKGYLQIGFDGENSNTQNPGTIVKVRELIGYTADDGTIGTTKGGEYYLKYYNGALELKSSGTTPIKIFNDSSINLSANTDKQRQCNINILAKDNIELKQGAQFLKLTPDGLRYSTGETGNIELLSSSDIKLDAQSLVVTGAASIRDNLSVSKNTTLWGVLNAEDNVILGKKLQVVGAADLYSTLNVTDKTILKNTLNVSKSTTLEDTLQVSKGTTLLSTLTVSAETSLGSTLNVKGTTDLLSTLDVKGATTLQDNLTVSKQTRLQDNVYIAEKLLPSGAQNYIGTRDVGSIYFPAMGVINIHNIPADTSPYSKYGFDIAAYDNHTAMIHLGAYSGDNNAFSGFILDLNGYDTNLTLTAYNTQIRLQDNVKFVTGSLTLSPNKFGTYYALDCNNSSIIGINNLYIEYDTHNTDAGGLHFQSSDTTKVHSLSVDRLGLLSYKPNRLKNKSGTSVFSVDAAGVVTANKFKGVNIPISIAAGDYGLCLYNNDDGVIPANNYISFKISAYNKSILAGNNITDIGDSANYFKELYINEINLGYIPLKDVQNASVEYLELANENDTNALAQVSTQTYLSSGTTYLCTLKCYYREDNSYITVSTVLTASDQNSIAYSGCIYIGTYALPLRLRYMKFQDGALRTSTFSIVKTGTATDATATLSGLFKSIRLTIKRIA